MYKKIKNSSFMNWLWFLVYLMPFIIAFVFCIGAKSGVINYTYLNGNLGIESYTFDQGYLGNYMNAFQKALGGETAQQGYLYQMYRSLLEFFFDGSISGNQLFDKLLPSILQYYSIVPLIHLAFDFLMLLPNICHKFMEKVGGERD